MLRYDLHSHSTRSDGLLTPAELVRRAVDHDVDVLCLTDHDELGGLEEAHAAAEGTGLRLIDGAELSVSWRHITLHVVGLGVNPASRALAEGLAAVRDGRTSRARRIGESLGSAGIPGAYEGAMKYVTSERLISRTHFARFLVEAGYVRTIKDVFTRFLTPGKPGYVPHQWTDLATAIGWIHIANGQAVLAHPGRYKVTARELRELLTEFRDLSGDAIEVLSPSHTPAQTTQFARAAHVFGLLASSGSDFHGPGESWIDVGDMPALPVGTTPVWRGW